jgi:hypothetical protein
VYLEKKGREREGERLKNKKMRKRVLRASFSFFNTHSKSIWDGRTRRRAAVARRALPPGPGGPPPLEVGRDMGESERHGGREKKKND